MGLRFRSGSSRWVLLVGRYAIKVPRLWPLDRIARGRASNGFEAVVWRELAQPLGWSTMLAPILRAAPGGWMVVVRRVEPLPIVTADEALAIASEPYPAPPCEVKPEDWGRINGRPVAADYADAANFPVELPERLKYYRKFLGR